MQSIYWVLTRKCTQSCSHCYISCGPDGESLSENDVDRIVENLSPTAEQIILAGGELLVVKPLLLRALDGLYSKYANKTKLMIQTNGDLLDEESVEEILDHHVCRIDVSSMDEFHNNRYARERIDGLLASKGMTFLEFPKVADDDGNVPPMVYSFWGSTPDLWLGGMWPRGRALENSIWSRNPAHNFCGIWSGGIGFLENDSPAQEINIRLSQAYPCCPATKVSLCDVRNEPLLDILDRYRDNPVFEALNKGEPVDMGIEYGISREFASRRIEELGSCCLWCDEFFEKYYSKQSASCAVG